MYNSKMVVAIKHNGKILRENKDVVYLPWGSEFSVLVKNLNSRRAKFSLSIDGVDALDGVEIIVNANSETEIKRFIRNGNMDAGNAFKFIERTNSIETGPRGIKIDDGVVRVEFWFEQEKPEIKINDIYWEKHHYRDYYQQFIGNPWHTPHFGPILSDYTTTSISATSASANFSDTADKSESINSIISNAVSRASMPMNDVGITVPGSKVEQTFTSVYGFNSEINSNTIILRLAGQVGETIIIDPITVKHKPECITCGKVNKANSKFCSECGTALNLI